ncbi:S-layer homology domain-containing protein [Psychrobacillus sp. FSL H8-0487]|uniref:S-layer homology domain-containing protein n=1 Tax=Psychrobacillus sp. FSL H8-0487 TaxID=2921391 RepID=UPI0030FC2CC4
MKHIITFVLVLSFFWAIDQQEVVAETDQPKIGVLFHGPSNTYTKTKKWSLSNDKAEKLYQLYQSQDFQVSKITENELKSLSELRKYDAIVFPYTVMMNVTERENVKLYVQDGGGAIFAFGTARNESAHMDTVLINDKTPLIYDTLTWIWEWDNLTEVFASRFIDDVQLTNFTVNNTSNKHPILTNSYKELGKTNFSFTNTRLAGDWVEVIEPWNNAISPLLTYTNYSATDKPGTVKKGTTGAAYAVEHGKGRMVYIGFKMYDHITAGKLQSWDKTTGDKEGQVFLKHSLNWVAEPHTTEVKRKYNVSLTQSNVSAYQRASDFVVYSTVSVENKGNVPARGTLHVDVLDSNDKLIATTSKMYLPGLSPDKSSYRLRNEKFQLSLPKKLTNGTYTIKAIFTEGRKDRTGIAQQIPVVASTKIFKKVSSSNYAVIGEVPFFPDVSKSNAAYQDMLSLYQLGVIKGSKGKFYPTGTLSRVQATEMILRSLGINASGSATMSVTDMKKGDYGYSVLATGVRYGIIEPQNGKINAFQPMKRDVMAKAIVKGFKLQGINDYNFKDISPTHPYYKEITTLYTRGITTGFTVDNTYRPNDTVTRQQFASFINRALH